MRETTPPSNYCVCLDDDPIVHRLIAQFLGVPVKSFRAVEDLLEVAMELKPYTAFVDVHLEDRDSGLNVIPKLRDLWPHTPLIVVTADPDPGVLGDSLSLGAHDFIKKPLDPTELRARVRVRQVELRQRERRDKVRLGDLVGDSSTRQLEGPAGRHTITQSEWEMLEHLLQFPGTIVPKAELKAKVWRDLHVSDNSVDRKVTELRKALEAVGCNVQIESLYGRGLVVTVRDREAGKGGVAK